MLKYPPIPSLNIARFNKNNIVEIILEEYDGSDKEYIDRLVSVYIGD